MRLDIRSDFPLTGFNTFGIRANARRFVSIGSADALLELRSHPEWSTMPHLVLGGGSNILFTRDYDGLVVHVATDGVRHLGHDGDGDLLEVEAGTSWDGLVRDSVERGWPGLENLALIPGSVGAAPVQNIGAYGVELSDRFAWLDWFDLDRGTTRRLDGGDCAFGYRDSVFKHALKDRGVILRVTFRLPRPWTAVRGYADVRDRLAAHAIVDPTPRQMVDVVTAIRREKLPDPAVVGNAGSFFKNPIVPATVFDALLAMDPKAVGHRQPDGRVKVAAAWLIDRCGWRGRVWPDAAGRVAVHERQALVLVNRGGATGRDVLDLADAIRESVFQRFGIELMPEPLIV